MNTEHFLQMMVERIDRDLNRVRVTNKQLRRLKRIARGYNYNWVRTPAKAWKAFGRDEQHKWRRRRGITGGWEYCSDRDLAHQSMAALNPDLSQAQERAHG